MHISAAVITAILSFANAIAIPQDAITFEVTDFPNNPSPATDKESIPQNLSARDLVTETADVSLVARARTSGGTNLDIAGVAVDFGQFVFDQIKDMTDFNDIRRNAIRAYTQGAMANRNPDRARWPAAVCYNNGYKLADPSNINVKSSIKISAGLLHATYDCFYLGKGNTFWSEGDGGYLNLHITSASGVCRFDDKSDMYC